jgi:hypothetical protein
MRVEILQPFTCSQESGSIDLKAGQIACIEGDSLLAALEGAGYIRRLADAAAETSDDFTVRHIGRGRYAIHKGDERVGEPMAKEDAEAALAGMLS